MTTKTPYDCLGKLCALLLSLTVVVYQPTNGLNVLYTVRITGDILGQIHGLSLPNCARQCKALDGCAHINYNRMIQLCEFVRASSTRSDDELNFITMDIADGFEDTAAIVQCDDIMGNVRFCPALVTDDPMRSIGNMDVTGTKKAVVCAGVYTLVGDMTTWCTEGSTWTEHGRCVKLSTIRTSCQTDADCVDDESECRSSKCWCKPQLSHNPATNSCVDFCPGEYGPTFQVLENHKIAGHNIYMERNIATIAACIEMCLNHQIPGYVCKYVDFYADDDECWLNVLPENTLPPLTTPSDGTFLQRDCAN